MESNNDTLEAVKIQLAKSIEEKSRGTIETAKKLLASYLVPTTMGARENTETISGAFTEAVKNLLDHHLQRPPPTMGSEGVQALMQEMEAVKRENEILKTANDGLEAHLAYIRSVVAGHSKQSNKEQSPQSRGQDSKSRP
jgi:signal-transduction protein with cAMP-binding, CBS, and nucleotidyltransferase domain